MAALIGFGVAVIYFTGVWWIRKNGWWKDDDPYGGMPGRL